MDGPNNLEDSMGWHGVWVAAQRVRFVTAIGMAEGANASKMGKE